jgi:c-di-GMP-binding flagellar brake protein YcgR
VGFRDWPMERRRHERLDLSAPVKFAWKTDDSTRREGSGVTRNFSAGGLFVMTEDPPPVGTTVHLEVDLKTSRLDSTVTVLAKGQVKRIESTGLVGQLGGFAVSARRMRLEKPEPSTA